jgi:opacity protein-like surface antigen
MRSLVITLAVAVAVTLAPTAQAADAGHPATFGKTYHHAKAGKRHAVVAHTAAIVCRTRSC